MKMFIIGPIAREKEIAKIASYYRKMGYDVKHVRSQPEKAFYDLVCETFKKIEEADIIIAVQKEEGGLGEGTAYEVAYARSLGKDVSIFKN